MNKLLTSAALATSLLMAPLAVAAEEITMSAVSLVPKKAGIARGFHMFVDEINEKFKGEFQIDWRGGPEVMPPFKQAEGVRGGAVDIAFTSPSYYSGLVSTSPTMNLSFKDYNEIKASGYYDRMAEIHAERGLVLLGEVPATDVQFYIFLSDKIDSLDDLKGLRIRVFPSLLPMIESLGATPLVLPMGEIYTAMERGAIDGFVRGKVGWAEQFEGLVKYVVTPGVYRAGFPILVNADAWAEVPEDLQNRIRDFVQNDLAPRIDDSWGEFIALGDSQMEKAGFETIVLRGEDHDAYIQNAIASAWGAMAESAGMDAAAELEAMLVD